MEVRVEWDFGDTELEDTLYEESVMRSGLPTIVKIPTDIAYEDEEIITDWISDEYGFTILNWWVV
jgi:hypothetical protein